MLNLRSLLVFLIGLLICCYCYGQLSPEQEGRVKSVADQYFFLLERLASDYSDDDFRALVDLFTDPSNNQVYNDLLSGTESTPAMMYLNRVRENRGHVKFQFSDPEYYYKPTHGHLFGIVKVKKIVTDERYQAINVENVLAIDVVSGKIGEIDWQLPEDVIPFSAEKRMKENALNCLRKYPSELNKLSNPAISKTAKEQIVKEMLKKIFEQKDMIIYNDIAPLYDGSETLQAQAYLDNIIKHFSNGETFEFSEIKISEIYFDPNEEKSFLKATVTRILKGLQADSSPNDTLQLDIGLVFNHEITGELSRIHSIELKEPYVSNTIYLELNDQ